MTQRPREEDSRKGAGPEQSGGMISLYLFVVGALVVYSWYA